MANSTPKSWARAAPDSWNFITPRSVAHRRTEATLPRNGSIFRLGLVGLRLEQHFSATEAFRAHSTDVSVWELVGSAQRTRNCASNVKNAPKHPLPFSLMHSVQAPPLMINSVSTRSISRRVVVVFNVPCVQTCVEPTQSVRISRGIRRATCPSAPFPSRRGKSWLTHRMRCGLLPALPWRGLGEQLRLDRSCG